MNRFELVVVGGGLTGARAIESYRDAGGEGGVALLSAEGHLPYHRPALSKRYLRGEVSAPYVQDEAFYREHDVELLLGSAATGVDPSTHVVQSASGPVAYEKVLVAAGATPRHLPVEGGDLDGVYALRTLDDSDRIRDATGAAERAVVVGGGFIGMEVAASLRQLGLAVTLIHMAPALFDQLRSEALSEELLALYRDRGVEVLLEEEVARFGGDGRVEWVEAKSGVCVEADLAVAGVGVVPNVSFLDRSGIKVDNGVVVNERFETNLPGVYAAGDVANFFDPLYGRRRRIEHWSNANYQGTEVGRILAGQGGGYDTVSSFFSEVFATTIKVFGDTGSADESSAEGSLASGLLESFGEAGRLVGAIAVGQSDEVETLIKDLIVERAPSDALTRELVGGRSG